MKRQIALIALAILLMYASNSIAMEPAYREIQLSLSIGPAIPTGDWDNFVENGTSANLEISLAFTPSISAGLHMGFGSFKTKYENMWPHDPSKYSDHWARYSGGVFGEYRIGVHSFVPFVSGRIGMQGIYVSYIELIDGMEGQGEFGFGYGISGGMRYRTSERYGFLIRLDAENSPDMREGWYYLIQLGVSFHL